MFTGYSALAWAEALKDKPDAEVYPPKINCFSVTPNNIRLHLLIGITKIVCLDIPGQSTDFAKETFVKTKVDSIIKVIEGNAETR